MCSQKCARPEMFAGSDKEPVKKNEHGKSAEKAVVLGSLKFTDTTLSLVTVCQIGWPAREEKRGKTRLKKS